MPRVNFNDLEYDVDGLVLHEGVLFTGDAFELYPNGALESEDSYRMGRLHGIGREYFPTGELKAEYGASNGVADGIRREWNAEGRLLKEEHYARGILLKRLEPDEKGDLHVTFELTPDHPNYQLLPAELRKQ